MSTFTCKQLLITYSVSLRKQTQTYFPSTALSISIIFLCFLAHAPLFALDPEEAPDNVLCQADAGSLSPDCSNGEFCLISGSVEISASLSSNPSIPAGYALSYLLTQGTAQVIVDNGPTARFGVSRTGRYGIHAFVYDPNPGSPDYLDLAGLISGQPTLATFTSQINALGVCADLDQTGAFVRVRKCFIPFLIQAKDDFLNTLTDTPVEGNILNNDMLQAGVMYDLNLLSGPFNGTLALNGDGSLVYIPDPGFVGQDEFTYQVCDNTFCPPRCVQATAYIEIIDPLPVNNPPIANLDAACVPQGGQINIAVLANDIDQDGDILQNPRPHSNPSNGSLIYEPDGTITYIPSPGFSGYDAFEYQVCDPGNPPLCDVGLVTIRVKPPLGSGNPPIPLDDAITMPVNTGRQGETVIENDREPDGDPITYSLFSGPQHGTLTFRPDGTYDYIPDLDYVGPDFFVYTMTDKDGSARANVIITVHGTGTSFPVEWLSLGATLVQEDGQISWETANELNSDRFEIERSVDQGVHFDPVGEVSAQGNSREVSSYSFLDKRVLDLGVEKLFYRLKQIDLDGTFSYSRTLELDLGKAQRIRLQLSPNPVRDRVQINWIATEAVYQIRMLNLLGEEVQVRDFPSPSQTGSLEWEVGDFAKGIYVLQVYSANLQTEQKLLIY